MQDVLVQPSGTLSGALGYSIQRQLLVIVVEHFEGNRPLEPKV
jgi:hypothetical protein